MPSHLVTAQDYYNDQYAQYDSQDSDFDDGYLEPEFPSSAANLRPAKKPKVPKKGVKQKAKAKARAEEEAAAAGPCHLLNLPEDVLHSLLVRIPPRTLLQLAATCKALNEATKSEAVWRQSFVNRYFWDGASTDYRSREEVKALVQGCMGYGGRGWKKEALSREGMLERWVSSRASNVVHHPHNVLTHSLSLAYPPQLPLKGNALVVGKMTSKSTKPPGDASPLLSSPSPHLSHRQKYEAMLAVTSRPAPFIYTACQEVAAVIKSDPLSGKVSKGFWGPGQDANFHLRPHWDPGLVSSIFLPKRSQTHMLWGLMSGVCVHTTIQSRTHATHGGRATSLNISCELDDMHEGAILSIFQPESTGVDPLKWVTGGQDGRVKYWQLNPGVSRSGKKTPADAVPASITCLFSSEQIEAPLKNRSEEVKLRQITHPDGVYIAACDIQHDVVCGVTEDGDLRVWFDVENNPQEARVDVGSAADLGGVRRMQLLCRVTSQGLVASVLIHHHKHPNFARYDISIGPNGPKVTTIFYGTSGEAALTCVRAFLAPNPPISQPQQVEPTLSARIVTPSSASGTATPAELDLEALPRKLDATEEYGRVVMAGDEFGRAYIWEWDGHPVGDVVYPMRDWSASKGKITAVDMSCSLVAVGSFSGHVDIFDPLPPQPEHLRGFRPPTHLTPADLLVAETDEFRAKYFNVNHLILENDLIIAAVGRNILAWRAGTGKGRQSGKDGKQHKGAGGPSKAELRSNTRTLDLRDLHQDAVDSHYEIQAENEASRAQTSHEEQHIAAMEDLGLEDGDAALEYALMLSQQEADAAPAPVVSEPETHVVPDAGEDGAEMSDDEAEAIRLVQEFERAEAASRERAAAAEDEDDLADILEQIRLSEAREREA